MRTCCRGLLHVVLVSFISLAFAEFALPQAPSKAVAKYVYGDDPDAGTQFYQEQDADRWCWAATASMIMAFHGRGYWLQCIQADDAYPWKSVPRTCCEDLANENPLCNRSGWPHFEHYGFQYQMTDQPLGWDQLVEQIDNKLPVAVAVQFFTGGGHMGAAVGYQIDTDGTKYVLAIDPDGFHEAYLVRFDELFGVSANGAYKHWRTYYNIKP
ncbi:MAG: C39 family peptidase [Nitrospirae bacterium]|nr:C39 family peptidase [Nitrospirota bacterium]